MASTFLIYISRAVQPLSEMELKYLAKLSSDNNAKRQITGLLLQVGNYFIQVLEGDGKQIDHLLTKIERDPRHADVQYLYRDKNAERIFSKWNMGYFDLERHYLLNRLDINDLKRHVEHAFASEKSSSASLVKIIHTLPKLMEATTPQEAAVS